MTQQTALSLSEYIASEKKRLDEFDREYRNMNAENAVQYPLIMQYGDWDESYYQWSAKYW